MLRLWIRAPRKVYWKRGKKSETEGINSEEGTEEPNRLLKVLIH
jgi:hypothetical protein